MTPGQRSSLLDLCRRVIACEWADANLKLRAFKLQLRITLGETFCSSVFGH